MPSQMTAVVLSRGDRTALEACLGHLRRGAREKLEIVVVGPPTPWLAGQRDVRVVRGDLRAGIEAATGDLVVLLDDGDLLPPRWSDGLVLPEDAGAIGPVAHGLTGAQHDGAARYSDLRELRGLSAARRRQHGPATRPATWLAPRPLLARRCDLLAVPDLEDPAPALGPLLVSPGVLAHVEPRPGPGTWPHQHPAPLLTAALIVKDEEAALPSCLASLVGIVDEVIVMDTGSTDTTLKIAREHGATVLQIPWDDDFSAARNAALEACSGVWVLSIDADEQLQVDDVVALRTALAHSSDDALRLPIRSRTQVDDAVGYEHHAARLLRRGAVSWIGALHEVPVRVGTAGWVDTPAMPGIRLSHDGYLEATRTSRGKQARNLRLAERDLDRTPAGDPRRWKVTYELARTLGSTAAERVLDLTEECLHLAPPAHFRSNALVLRSSALLELGQPEAAEVAARSARDLSPHLITATLALAASVEVQGRAPEALALLVAWTPQGIDPVNETALQQHVRRLTNLLRPQAADECDPLRALETWSALPLTTTSRVGRSRCLLALGRVTDAAQALDGIDTEALDTDELFTVIAVAAAAGDRETAQQLLSRAGPLPPDLAAEAAALGHLLDLPVRVEAS